MSEATQALLDAKAALLAEVEDLTTREEGWKAYAQGQPAIIAAAVAAAVANAQANAGLSDEQAAAITADINSAVAQLQAGAADVDAAVTANTPAQPGPTVDLSAPGAAGGTQADDTTTTS